MFKSSPTSLKSFTSPTGVLLISNSRFVSRSKPQDKIKVVVAPAAATTTPHQESKTLKGFPKFDHQSSFKKGFSGGVSKQQQQVPHQSTINNNKNNVITAEYIIKKVAALKWEGRRTMMRGKKIALREECKQLLDTCYSNNKTIQLNDNAVGALLNACASFGYEHHPIINEVLMNTTTSSSNYDLVSRLSSSSSSQKMELGEALQIVNALFRMGKMEVIAIQNQSKQQQHLLGIIILERCIQELFTFTTTTTSNKTITTTSTNHHNHMRNHFLQRVGMCCSLIPFIIATATNTKLDELKNTFLNLVINSKELMELTELEYTQYYPVVTNNNNNDVITENENPQQQQQQKGFIENTNHHHYDNNMIHRKEIGYWITIVQALLLSSSSSSSSNNNNNDSSEAAISIKRIAIDFLLLKPAVLNSMSSHQFGFFASLLKQYFTTRIVKNNNNTNNTNTIIQALLSVTEQEHFRRTVSLDALVSVCDTLSELAFYGLTTTNNNCTGDALSSADTSYQIVELLEYSIELLIKRSLASDPTIIVSSSNNNINNHTLVDENTNNNHQQHHNQHPYPILLEACRKMGLLSNSNYCKHLPDLMSWTRQLLRILSNLESVSYCHLYELYCWMLWKSISNESNNSKESSPSSSSTTTATIMLGIKLWRLQIVPFINGSSLAMTNNHNNNNQDQYLRASYLLQALLHCIRIIDTCSTAKTTTSNTHTTLAELLFTLDASTNKNINNSDASFFNTESALNAIEDAVFTLIHNCILPYYHSNNASSATIPSAAITVSIILCKRYFPHSPRLQHLLLQLESNNDTSNVVSRYHLVSVLTDRALLHSYNLLSLSEEEEYNCKSLLTKLSPEACYYIASYASSSSSQKLIKLFLDHYYTECEGEPLPPCALITTTSACTPPLLLPSPSVSTIKHTVQQALAIGRPALVGATLRWCYTNNNNNNNSEAIIRSLLIDLLGVPKQQSGAATDLELASSASRRPPRWLTSLVTKQASSTASTESSSSPQHHQHTIVQPLGILCLIMEILKIQSFTFYSSSNNNTNQQQHQLLLTRKLIWGDIIDTALQTLVPRYVAITISDIVLTLQQQSPSSSSFSSQDRSYIVQFISPMIQAALLSGVNTNNNNNNNSNNNQTNANYYSHVSDTYYHHSQYHALHHYVTFSDLMYLASDKVCQGIPTLFLTTVGRFVSGGSSNSPLSMIAASKERIIEFLKACYTNYNSNNASLSVIDEQNQKQQQQQLSTSSTTTETAAAITPLTGAGVPASIAYLLLKLKYTHFMTLTHSDLVTIVNLLGPLQQFQSQQQQQHSNNNNNNSGTAVTAPVHHHRTPSQAAVQLVQKCCILLLQLEACRRDNHNSNNNYAYWEVVEMIVTRVPREWICQGAAKIVHHRLLFLAEKQQQQNSSSHQLLSLSDLHSLCNICERFTKFSTIYLDQRIWTLFAKYMMTNKEIFLLLIGDSTNNNNLRIKCSMLYSLLIIATKIQISELTELAILFTRSLKQDLLKLKSQSDNNSKNNAVELSSLMSSLINQILNPLNTNLPSSSSTSTSTTMLELRQEILSLFLVNDNENHTTTTTTTTTPLLTPSIVSSQNATNIVHLVHQFLLSNSSLFLTESLLSRLDLLLPSIRGKHLALCCCALGNYYTRTTNDSKNKDLLRYAKQLLSRSTLLVLDRESGCSDEDLFVVASSVLQSSSMMMTTTTASSSSSSSPLDASFLNLVKQRLYVVFRAVLLSEEDHELKHERREREHMKLVMQELERALFANSNNNNKTVVSEFADENDEDEENNNNSNKKNNKRSSLIDDYDPLYPISFAELPEYERTLFKLLTSPATCSGVYPLMREVLNRNEENEDERTNRAGSTSMIIKLLNWAQRRKGITDSEFINKKLWSS